MRAFSCEGLERYVGFARRCGLEVSNFNDAEKDALVIDFARVHWAPISSFFK